MRFELMYESFFKIVEGIPLTLQVVSISTILGIFLAVAVALMRISGNRLMSLPAYYFVYLIRGTPLLLQLYFVYYGLSQFEAIRESILWPILKEPYWCGIITLTISTGAYSSEIIHRFFLDFSTLVNDEKPENPGSAIVCLSMVCSQIAPQHGKSHL